MRAGVLGGRCSAERCPGDLLSGLHLPAGICGPQPWCCWIVDAGFTSCFKSFLFRAEQEMTEVIASAAGMRNWSSRLRG